MANEQWYVLKVRSGFAPIVAQKLRTLNLETFVPSLQSISRPKKIRQRPSTEYVYCRFALDERLKITTIAGVLDILGTPEPTPVDPRRVTQTMRS